MRVATVCGTRPELIKLAPLVPPPVERFEHTYPVTGQRQRGRRHRRDRAHGIALEGRDWHQAADRITGHAQRMLRRDLGGVLDLLGRAAQHTRHAGGGHCRG